jgi:hypothetical protein
MNKFLRLASFLTFVGLLVLPMGHSAEKIPDQDLWTAEFSAEKDELQSIGRNRYFILEPGYELILGEDGNRLVITVLNQTKTVDGVETRIVEERETKNGELVEVSRNYFAISKRTNSVYYFGEEVDNYEGGTIKNHSGSWQSGEKGSRFGLMMPGDILLKGRHYQEIALDRALDRAEILSISETIETPSGEYKNCLKVKETTPLEPDVVEYKYYAPGVGLIQEQSLKLTKHGKRHKQKK